ncbi:MAG: excinuclease ABC subunit UvrC [Clostridia bacterium]|nr:excinuclease ABC subunit UvrC [Clostridia bacterium]
MFDIPAELKKLPESPGVYIMRDKTDDIIYVGKAKILKNRVRQYFQNSANHSLKVKQMVSNIDHFEYIVTGSEVEALILENNLIKKHNPKYNILLKDDKTYPYIKVTTNEMFPRVFVTRKLLKDKNKYFGPFTNSSAVKENIALIDKIWQVRRCSKVFPRDIGKGRPCLNYHIGQCKAVCTGNVSEEEYNKMIGEILDFLGGKTENVVKNLTSKMLKYSAEMEFEKAAEVRDTIESIKILNQKQIIENLHIDDRDVIGFARGIRECIMQIFFIRGGKITGREHFMLEECEDVEDKELMTQFVQQFYSGTPFIPKEVILQCEIDDFDLISQWLSEQKGQRVNVLVPQKGERKSLVLMAQNNAKIVLDKFGAEIRREHKRTKGALEEIQKALNIDFELNRIESYDISNTQGFESVASMVVFENGLPKRSDYRKFKIKTIIGPDDYGSMEEVITRRFTRYINETSGDENVKKAGFDKKPDMIFLDGGKGQISAVQKALTNLNLYVPVCGMVKDDRHRTRALMYNGEEIELPYTSEGFKLLTRIQDEVHRFAIEYHRKLREKKQVHSILDDISGIGSVRRKALMKHFGDINAIRRAEVEELQQVDGMNIKSAEAVYNFFRK